RARRGSRSPRAHVAARLAECALGAQELLFLLGSRLARALPRRRAHGGERARAQGALSRRRRRAARGRRPARPASLAITAAAPRDPPRAPDEPQADRLLPALAREARAHARLGRAVLREAGRAPRRFSGQEPLQPRRGLRLLAAARGARARV